MGDLDAVPDLEDLVGDVAEAIEELGDADGVRVQPEQEPRPPLTPVG